MPQQNAAPLAISLAFRSNVALSYKNDNPLEYIRFQNVLKPKKTGTKGSVVVVAVLSCFDEH